MNRVLVITSILPVSSIERKKNENDILLETEDRLKAFSNGILFSYFFVIPYANRLLSLLSPKWKSYCDLIQKEEIVLRGRKVIILGMIMFAKKFFFRSAYYHLALWINRKQIRRTIQNFQPTILHADNVDTSGFLARKIGEKYNIPYIITLRGIKQSHDQLVVKNLAGAKNLIAISANHQMQAKTITSRPIALIPHGISASFFISNVAKHAGKAIRVISVCRLIKLKNLDKVINALSSVEGNFIYDIYGEGPEQAFLDELIQEKGMTQKIKLKGFVPNSELPGVLMNAHLFIMPSYPESLGRVYFEAMAAGLPVIGAKNTGIDGLIEHGKEGFLVNHLNEPELAGILRDILNEPGVLYDMGIHARKKAEEFRWDRICGKLLNVYEDTEAIQIS